MAKKKGQRIQKTILQTMEGALTNAQYKKFYNNVVNLGLLDWGNDFNRGLKPQHILEMAFVWSLSPEGQKYWWKVYGQLVKRGKRIQVSKKTARRKSSEKRRQA